MLTVLAPMLSSGARQDFVADARRRAAFTTAGAVVALLLALQGALGLPAALMLIVVLAVVAGHVSAVTSSLLVCLVSTVLVIQTKLSGGPFPFHAPVLRSAYVQFYLIALVAVVLLQSSYRNQRNALMVRLHEAAEASRRQLAATVESERLYRTAFERAPVGNMLWSLAQDDFGAVLYSNAEAARILPSDPRELIGHRPIERLDEGDQQALRRRIAAELAGTAIDEHIVVRYVRPLDSDILLRLVMSPVRSAVSDNVHMMVLVEDVTDAELEEHRLRHLALHDALTGLPNRTLFEDRLDHAVAASGRSGQPVGLLYLDLDGFKAVNDTHGHNAGDDLLIEIRRRLQSATRPGDTPARLGGDEFAVICPEADDDGLLAVGKRIIRVVSGPITLPSGAIVMVKASIGAAHTTGDESRTCLVKRADTAMYAAKHGGRGQIRLASAARTASSR